MKKSQQKDFKKGSKKEKIKIEGRSLIKLYLNIFIFLFTFFLYSGTFNHEFVLDDTGVIYDNSMTREGVKALPKIFASGYRSTLTTVDNELYRPFSKALFAVEWQLMPGNPSAFHIVNTLLYALSCCLLFNVFFLFLKNLLVPFICTMLFAAHPIHTEVVANVKSADEICVLLFILLSMFFIHIYTNRKTVISLICSVFCFFLALLSKESAMVYILILPLAIYFFTNLNSKKIFFITAWHGLPVIVYLLIRKIVCEHVTYIDPSLTNYLYEIENILSQKATAIMLMGNYLRLLIFPYPLMTDGSFNQFPTVTIYDWKFLISFLIFLLLAIYAAITIKKKNIFSFSIILFFIASSIVSNIFILIGTNYGERLMYLPSLGFCLGISYLIVKFTSPKQIGTDLSHERIFKEGRIPIAITSVVVLIFSVLTFSRAADWHDELTLYKKDVITASSSARLHYYLGNKYLMLLQQTDDSIAAAEYLKSGLSELRKAVSIKPDIDEAYYSIGGMYTYIGLLDSAAANYLHASELNPLNPRFQSNYGDIMFRLNNLDEAIRRFKIAAKLDSLYTNALTNLGAAYAKAGETALTKARDAQAINDQKELEKNYNIAMQYYDSAIVWLNKSMRVDKDYYLPYYFLGLVYKNKGDEQSAQYYYSLSEELKSR